MKLRALGMIALLTGVSMSAASPALAQRQIDDPKLSPMLFGPTEKEKREKARQEREEHEREIEEALILTSEQEQDANLLDEPKTRPLLFGDHKDGEDLVGGSITLGEEDNDRRYFGILTFLIPDETNLSIGVGPVYEPDYFGSNDYEFNADPQVYVKFRNFVFLDDDGADFALFGFSRFRFGPSIRIRGRRDQDENAALQGLGDVGTTFELGGFASTTFLDRFAVKAKVRHGIKTGHRGTIVDGYLTALIFRAGPVSFSTSGHASWIGDNFADAYFTVTPEQSAASGGLLGVYDADSGFRNVGGSVNAYINIRDRWSLNPYASYNYIFDDYAATPIISQFGDRNQFRVGFHLMREFTFGGSGR
ncbi:MipA/OmpV family protein [Hyphococcus flavus]|uniref:MipA/OmpV family protein n=1 Tax=Hyphococcus flavus TaxID=1866326 RepID=A0AAE9ZEQ2_9PROT|nr:MipA/OmpV family protein [Hyphococcus flavus]WDI31443.1 MipA/OmpV family protein [Hyphococcus flavus]